MEKILDANDYAQTRGFITIRDLLKARDYKTFDTPFQDAEPMGVPVVAFVSFGFWIALCECNGAEYVAPGEPFYCHSCGNYANSGKPRPVIFPENKADIERELLRRPVFAGTGRNVFERTQRQRAAVQNDKGFLSRTWLPLETLDDLKQQNEAIPKRKKR